jgi:hypothetical protein
VEPEVLQFCASKNKKWVLSGNTQSVSLRSLCNNIDSSHFLSHM